MRCRSNLKTKYRNMKKVVVLLFTLFSSFYFEIESTQLGLFPELINLAPTASITANATCGANGQEFYCKVDPSGRTQAECGVCDDRSPDPRRRHPPQNAIDGTNEWWQSPSLTEGEQFQFVTLTVDLLQVYEIAYVILKSAISPRPGNWILEKSIDGYAFTPWQFYAVSDNECTSAYGLPATPGRPSYNWENDVICTSFYSQLTPLEGGEIHTTLMNRRPDSSEAVSETSKDFTLARFVRFRFQKMLGRVADADSSVLNRYFYSIKDINIGGRCTCNGHADHCDILAEEQVCKCGHNTCGTQCETCCPRFNQIPWAPRVPCEACQCHGHAEVCEYNPEIHQRKLSLNIRGLREGGGVCLDCRDFTAGVNCEKCMPGYYRPRGVPLDDPKPCLPCDCKGPTTTGFCVGDDKQANLGRPPGACLCKEGFAGENCNGCADGYLNYPQCTPCPCNKAGSVNNVCEGNCVCKENVIGPRCDTCVPTTFHLDRYNNLGCTKCFCNGVTDQCEAAKLAVYTISEKDRWSVTDLLQRRKVAATVNEFSVSAFREDMVGRSAYYWLAPSDYLGKRITSYGQNLRVRVSWVKLRGDISGGPTRCPDVIIEGGPYRIAFGANYYRNMDSVILDIPFYEQGWYHFPKELADIPFHMAVEEYHLGKVSRAEMMQVLLEFRTLMIRARYHSEQVEAVLHDVVLEYGKEDEFYASLVTGAVERCYCPPGYSGISCEECEPGYRRVDNVVLNGKCEKCACNGHVLACDPFTGECGECLHNTVGDRCQFCAPGFYGDPTQGTPDDCKPCECPYRIGKNDFVPECEADPHSNGFKCICPRGYDGPRCDRCADGYFGNPLESDKPCRPCDCSGNVDPHARGNCDPLTGRCLKCLGNTAGFNCERCKENHYGDPTRGQCFSCNCHPVGSLSEACNPETGNCPCKPLYTGKLCDRCLPGRGGISEGCPPCRCDPNGSMSDVCDSVTGLCPCKPGVGGRHCDSCLENHFGDISEGCSRCDCDPRGSYDEMCNMQTGQCSCRKNVVGRQCNSCKRGYWGLSVRGECTKCNCHPVGTFEGRCDDATGKCQCLPGVGGPECDRCLPGFWGFSATGCKACDPCIFPGRNCDLRTGKCVCPPNTEGDKCERCSQGFWKYSADIGCTPCNCSGPGSLERQCDPRNGQCICRDGHEGPLCNRCSYGYYGYPQCIRCNCNIAGTDTRRCRDEVTCQCDVNGQCPCKVNVIGPTCNQCASSTFGLSPKNERGCFDCFCFERSSSCRQADLTWSQLSLIQTRKLEIEYKEEIATDISKKQISTILDPRISIHPWNTEQICYINLALPGERRLDLAESETRLNVTNQLYVIPSTVGDVTIGTTLSFLAPIYWQLPRNFMRDKTTSYNGYLRFKVATYGNENVFPANILATYPLVSLQGNWQIVLEYYADEIAQDGRYSVKLHEDHWRRKGDHRRPLTRKEMMVALQNVQHILIRATHADDFQTATLSEVSLDIAAEGTPVSSRTALGVEQCICPPAYTGLSCQDPNIGYWRNRTTITETVVITILVGHSEPCNCNGRADDCDRDTGVCIDCRENTAGKHCEHCKTGYYGEPNVAPCQRCACPTRQTNHAATCEADPYAGYICHCQVGYTGTKCERCADGYYGNPTEPGGTCEPCNCDPHGSIGRGCDKYGNCRCKPGITGRDCSSCAPRHIVAKHGCIACDGECVTTLLDDIEHLIRQVEGVDLDSNIPMPWTSLEEFRNATTFLRSGLNKYESRIGVAQRLVDDFNSDTIAGLLLKGARRFKKNALENSKSGMRIKYEAIEMIKELMAVKSQIYDAISYLDNYAIGETPTMSITAALDEAEKILREIKRRDFTLYHDRAELELDRAEALLRLVLRMQQDATKVQNLVAYFAEVAQEVEDLIDKIRQAKRETSMTSKMDETSARKLRRIKSVLEEISVLNLYTEERNANSTRFLQRSSRNIKDIRRKFKKVAGLGTKLANMTEQVSRIEAKLWHVNNEYKDKWIVSAENHALNLEAQAIKLYELFSETRDVADGPLRAAAVYQEILDALLNAEQAARDASKAATDAYYVAYPGDPDNSLVRRGKWSMELSKNLRAKSNALQNRVDELSRELYGLRQKLELTRKMIEDSNRRLDGATHTLDTQFDRDISKDIKGALGKIETTNARLDETLGLIGGLTNNLTLLRSYSAQVNELDSTLYQGISKTISDIESKTASGKRLTIKLTYESQRIVMRGENILNRIRDLKRKIKQTRQHAASISVSLTTDESGICVRKYRTNLEPSTTTRLTLGYAINSEHRDALLLYMGSTNYSGDYMIVEMQDRKIHFTWDSGGGSKQLIHPLPLETNDFEASDETKWYHITITRIGNIGELAVRPAFFKNNVKKLYGPVRGVSSPGYSKMDFKPWDFTWIGRTPGLRNGFSPFDFQGCLHQVTIDGEDLGLWNFTESLGCSACSEGYELEISDEDKTLFGFNGKGYFKGDSRYRRQQPFYSVLFSFKTFDEDGLLFLTYNNASDQFISLSLKEGHVILTAKYDSETQLVIRSEQKVNSNELVQVQTDVQIISHGSSRMGKLVVGDQSKLETVKGGQDLNLSDEPFYFGGVDPEFDKESFGNAIELRSLLGCMGGLSVLEVGKNPHADGQFYGVERSCIDQPFSEAGFSGSGFLEMSSKVLKRKSNFGFTFKTFQPEALLMISTFVGQPIQRGIPNPSDYYSVSLIDGHLDIRLSAGAERHRRRLMSTYKFNDGKLHSFFALKDDEKVKLFVDDKLVNTTDLHRGSQVVEAPTEGGLFFGGVPYEINIGSMVASTAALKGCIMDVIINDNVLPFNDAVNFKRAQIGRCSNVQDFYDPRMAGDQAVSFSCHQTKYAEKIPGSLNFGDQAVSYAIIDLNPRTFRDDFSLSFAVRTFYSDGLILAVTNTRRSNVFSIQLLNSRLLLFIKNGRSWKKIVSPVVALNSGEWRSVEITKKSKSLLVYIDGRLSNDERISKQQRFGSKLYVGGMTKIKEKKLPIFSRYIGCFKDLVVNGKLVNLSDSSRTQSKLVNVGQCFKNVQDASYFKGNSYAIYDKNFEINEVLEVELEFKTTRSNGVLLSTEDRHSLNQSSAAFSLHIVNGEIVIYLDLGPKSYVSAQIPAVVARTSPLCDNRWHALRALYAGNSLRIRLDLHEEVFGEIGDAVGMKIPFNGELYVGGLPEDSNFENFSGCIRNLKINRVRKNWTDMFRLKNVLIGQCPASSA